ncbi:inositol monophosphatase [Roseateles sp. DAIF2]|uniref:inositol monophosphatase family protein n=1 Tax=Roseateles sp. DAIF2 TaxID=2714952 RepID=UPI0018A30089|nr:inositol monophosphatase family protein [Roseateles sp. DAIF2]QPF75535.1 inositol monophosphatase [Roseateles sp. DAIF2]
MHTDSLLDHVAALLRDTATTLIAPRFRRLSAGEAIEKSPGEWVTVVDREVEARLTPALRALLPGSVVVGEEQCAATPQLLDRLDEGRVWLVDPLDGTNNFIAGREPLSSMVALLEHGETVAAWMLDPLSGVLHRAQRGGGAWRDGERLRIDAAGAGLRRTIVKTRFLPEAEKARMAAWRDIEILPGVNCAGAEYPALAAGDYDAVLYWRTLAWDHAPGTLFIEEAGGRAARLDREPYRASDPRTGLLVARSPAIWEEAIAAWR